MNIVCILSLREYIGFTYIFSENNASLKAK